VEVPLTQGQFDALVDFCFNLGAGRLASSSLLKDLNASKYDEAARQLLLWDHAAGQENAALKARREAEAALWRSNDAGQPAAA
jgi:lysozyme